MADQRKRPNTKQPDIDVRIAELSRRVFLRLEGWAKMALIATLVLGGSAWVLGLVAVSGLRSFPIVAIFLIIVLIPAFAAWIIGRRATAIHQGVDGLQADIKSAISDPQIRDLFDGFLGSDDDGDDGRAGLARLAKGALGVRRIARDRKDSLFHLWGAVRAMVTAPGVLVVITLGMVCLGCLIVLFGLIAVL